jgi:hypothetical protein
MPKQANPLRGEAPWYRQAGFWWLMTPPFAAVVGGIITLMLAINHPDQLLPGDPAGSTIPQALIQEAQAHSRNITATLEQQDGRLLVRLAGRHGQPGTLLLQLQPWGHQGHLQHLVLHASAEDLYQTQLPAGFLSQGNWYGELSPENGKWLLTGPVHLGGTTQAMVMGGTQARR